MDYRERLNDPEEAVRVSIEGLLAGVRTSIPGILQEFFPATQTASVQVAIQSVRDNPDGTKTSFDVTLLTDVPVQFQRGGGFCATFPLVAGNEGLLIVSDRCIDAWWQNGAADGGGQPQMDMRMHDLSDCVFIPGISSQPEVIPNISTTTMQLRSDDGSTYFELAPAGIVNVVAPGGMNITTPLLTLNGSQLITGTLVAENIDGASETSSFHGNIKITDGDVIADTISLKTHVHNGVQTGGGDTGEPVP